MSNQTDILALAKTLNDELVSFGVTHKSDAFREVADKSQYDVMITNKSLRLKTEKLFKDGHHARAVEEAYKLIDNLVKKHAGLSGENLTGAKLMQKVFGVDNPLLKLNAGASTSEKDEQLGYMMIFSGCMTGIRNPRAHETDWEDTEQRSLQLLSFANHLIERVLNAEKQSAFAK